MIAATGSGSTLFLNTLLLSWKKNAWCMQNKLSQKIQWRKMEVDKTHKSSRLASHLAIWSAVNLCSNDNGIALLPFATCLHLTRYMFPNILIQYWVSTLAASIFRPRHTATEWKCSESTQHFLSQLAWHIVKDSGLIIPWQRHRPASPFGLSWTTEAVVWFLSVCYVLSQIGSYPPEI